MIVTLPFHDLINSSEITRFLESAGKYRRRIYSPEITLKAFLSQVVCRGHSCQDAVTGVQLERSKDKGDVVSFNTACYTRARQRLNLQAIKDMCRGVHDDLKMRAKDKWRWKGRRVTIIDGSTITMADTAENIALYSKSGHASEFGGFPMARIMLACSLETGSVSDIGVASWRGKLTGEIPLAAKILASIETGSVVVGDAMFVSYSFICLCQKSGLDFVAPRKSNRKYAILSERAIAQGDRIIQIKKPPRIPRTGWLDDKDYYDFPDCITLRETQVKIERPGFRAKSITILSTLTDPDAYSAGDIANLLMERWNIETDLRIIKRELGLNFVRVKTPEMVIKEIWIKLLAFNLIRRLINTVARAIQVSPRRISFKKTLGYYLGSHHSVKFNVDNICENAVKAISQFILPKQFGRMEPRARKSSNGANDYPRLSISRKRWRAIQIAEMLCDEISFSPMLNAALDVLKSKIPKKNGRPMY